MNETIKWLILFFVFFCIVVVLFLKNKLGHWVENLFRKKEYVISWRVV